MHGEKIHERARPIRVSVNVRQITLSRFLSLSFQNDDAPKSKSFSASSGSKTERERPTRLKRTFAPLTAIHCDLTVENTSTRFIAELKEPEDTLFGQNNPMFRSLSPSPLTSPSSASSAHRKRPFAREESLSASSLFTPRRRASPSLCSELCFAPSHETAVVERTLSPALFPSLAVSLQVHLECHTEGNEDDSESEWELVWLASAQDTIFLEGFSLDRDSAFVTKSLSLFSAEKEPLGEALCDVIFSDLVSDADTQMTLADSLPVDVVEVPRGPSTPSREATLAMRMQRFSALSTHDAVVPSPLSSPSRASTVSVLSPNRRSRHPAALSLSPRELTSPQKKERAIAGQRKRKQREKNHSRYLHPLSSNNSSESLTSTHMDLQEEEECADEADDTESVPLFRRRAFWCVLLLVQSLLTLTLGISTFGLSQFSSMLIFSFSSSLSDSDSEGSIASSSKELVPFSTSLSFPPPSPSSFPSLSPLSCPVQEKCVAHYNSTVLFHVDSNCIASDKRNKTEVPVSVVVGSSHKCKQTYPTPLSLSLSPRQSMLVEIFSPSKGLCLQWQARFVKGTAVWEHCEDFGSWWQLAVDEDRAGAFALVDLRSRKCLAQTKSHSVTFTFVLLRCGEAGSLWRYDNKTLQFWREDRNVSLAEERSPNDTMQLRTQTIRGEEQSERALFITVDIDSIVSAPRNESLSTRRT